MCATCGCDDPAGTRVSVIHHHDDDNGHDGHDGHESHDRAAAHPRPHQQHDPVHAQAVPVTVAEPEHRRTIDIERNILDRNDALAQANRRWLAERRIVALNMMSSPGSGKTTLLQRTIGALQAARPVAVIEGDQETHLDAERIRSTGVPVVQINTGAGCHLDADMLRRGLEALGPAEDSVVFVENVGNLVCPALFDLGETARVVVISVTEGDDKPLKYPHMFAAADLLIVNKTDLLPYVDFSVTRCTANARSTNPGLDVLPMSLTTGEGLQNWTDWVATQPHRSPPVDGR
jgi:hydrogenase nickel incorporation protein HypB